MAENGLNLEEIRQQSRHKRYEILQGYIQMSDQHIKDAYMKGLNLDKNQKSVKTQETTMDNSKQDKQLNENDNP